MKAFRASQFARSLVAAVMLLSWLVLTNHCALAAILPSATAKSIHAHCHAAMHQDGKKSPNQGIRECCQAVKASLTSKIVVKVDASSSALPVSVILAVLAPRADEPAVELLQDHGPPGAISFAEIVLQRSLLSHAPPVSV
ncbi:MAG TPA: hypothetical protein VGM54_15665 [Chthoniobacter sp.]